MKFITDSSLATGPQLFSTPTNMQVWVLFDKVNGKGKLVCVVIKIDRF